MVRTKGAQWSDGPYFWSYSQTDYSVAAVQMFETGFGYFPKLYITTGSSQYTASTLCSSSLFQDTWFHLYLSFMSWVCVNPFLCPLSCCFHGLRVLSFSCPQIFSVRFVANSLSAPARLGGALCLFSPLSWRVWQPVPHTGRELSLLWSIWSNLLFLSWIHVFPFLDGFIIVVLVLLISLFTVKEVYKFSVHFAK